MNSEGLKFCQVELFKNPKFQDKRPEKDKKIEVLESEGFDLMTFFGVPNDRENVKLGMTSPDSVHGPEKADQPLPDLLVTLRNDANESIATITSKVTAETFAAGSSLTSSVFSAFSSLVGSCGVFCAHTLGSLGQVGSGLSGASGLGGLNMPDFSVDKHGNFHLDGNLDSLSRATGLSKTELLAGRFSAEDVLTTLFSVFGEGIGQFFGFGIVETLIDCLFSAFLPHQESTGELSTAA